MIARGGAGRRGPMLAPLATTLPGLNSMTSPNISTPQASPFPVDECRRQFPGLARNVGDRRAVFFDGPAGSQTPQRVIDAISNYLIHTNANHGGLFATSQASDALLDDAHQAVADFLGADDPRCVAFGANMTTMNLALSRALARTWRPGDEVVVTRLDHDANVTPWELAARDVGAIVKHVAIRPEDSSLDLDDLRRQLTPRTRLVATTCASNAVGTLTPVRDICRMAHEVGALAALDAVHYAPHGLIDVIDWECDFLLCSAYKFFGPHVGILWGRRSLLESLAVYKLRVASDELPSRWMTGTQNHEGIAGVAAAVDYLADLGSRVVPSAGDRRSRIRSAFTAIGKYEKWLTARLLAGLRDIADVRIWGVSDENRLDARAPTIAITHRRYRCRELAARLASEAIFVWHGNFYALPLTESLGLEPDGLVRIGLLHYNTAEEVNRLLTTIANG